MTSSFKFLKPISRDVTGILLLANVEKIALEMNIFCMHFYICFPYLLVEITHKNQLAVCLGKINYTHLPAFELSQSCVYFQQLICPN